jgi:hypothetical protein
MYLCWIAGTMSRRAEAHLYHGFAKMVQERWKMVQERWSKCGFRIGLNFRDV